MCLSASHLDTKDFNISLIGAGTLGSQLARALKNAGYRIDSIISRTKASAMQLANAIEVEKYGNDVHQISEDTNLILIATNDSQISAVANKLSEQKLQHQHLFVVHFSGALSSSALMPLQQKAAVCLSLHPFQTFAQIHQGAEQSRLFNCSFGLESPSRIGVELGKKLAHDLGGKAILIPKEAKTRYHIAAVMISNYLVTLSSLSAEIFSTMGLNEKEAFEVFEPILHQSLANMKDSESLRDALTGPIERGDASTIKKHLAELDEKMPHLIPVYSMLAMETVRIAGHKGSIDTANASSMHSLLDSALKNKM